MKKILFIEDELPENIPTILRLFRKFINPHIRDILEKAEGDGYALTNDAIKTHIESSGVIEIEYSFIEALKKISNYYKNYSLFIIDRNLKKNDYSESEIQNINQNFNLKEFAEREGDFLFRELVIEKQTDITNKFYFFSAYTDDIKILLPSNLDKEKYFIEKSNPEQTERLIYHIENCNDIILHYENKNFIDILNRRLSCSLGKDFYTTLVNKDDKSQIDENLQRLRNIYLGIFNKCKSNITKFEYKTYQNIKKERHGAPIAPKICSCFLISLFKIGSEASHTATINKESEFYYEPTINTVNSLIYALKDVISWFDQIN